MSEFISYIHNWTCNWCLSLPLPSANEQLIDSNSISLKFRDFIPQNATVEVKKSESATIRLRGKPSFSIHLQIVYRISNGNIPRGNWLEGESATFI